jgi:hypothetical protein
MTFMKPEYLLPCSQQPVTRFCPAPVEPRPCTHIIFPLATILILSSHVRQVCHATSSLQGFYAFLIALMRATRTICLILLVLIILFNTRRTKIMNFFIMLFFFILLLHPLSQVHLFSVCWSQTSSSYVLPCEWERENILLSYKQRIRQVRDPIWHFVTCHSINLQSGR